MHFRTSVSHSSDNISIYGLAWHALSNVDEMSLSWENMWLWQRFFCKVLLILNVYSVWLKEATSACHVSLFIRGRVGNFRRKKKRLLHSLKTKAIILHSLRIKIKFLYSWRANYDKLLKVNFWMENNSKKCKQILKVKRKIYPPQLKR